MSEYLSSPEYQTQREVLAELRKPHPTVIAIEGGPCSGKTTLMERLRATAGERQVVFLPEAATEHIAALQAKDIDIAQLPHTDRAAWLRLERDILGTIVGNLEQARETYAGTDAIIVTDRCDIGAYVTPEEHARLLNELGLLMPPMLSHVDQLYFLPSLARIDMDRYEVIRRRNPARVESADRARQVCARNLESVARHPELHIAWGGEFEETLRRLADSVVQPELESEIKLQPVLGEEPMAAFLRSSHEVARSAIVQTYHELDGTTFRLREVMTEQGERLRYFTTKRGEGVHRREVQRQVDEMTFNLLGACPRVGEPLLKERTLLLRDELDGKKRAWACDRYFDRRIGEWSIETDVRDEAEAALLRSEMAGFDAAPGAEKLARSLGLCVLKPVLS